MPAPVRPALEKGRVYRTRDLAVFGSNPTRLAKRLLEEGVLVQLAQGLFHAPETSRFGPLPPSTREVLRSFLGTDDFLITGPALWAALGLGVKPTSAAVTLAYNAKRSGDFQLGDHDYHLRRVRYPEHPSREWFVVDLVEHAAMASRTTEELEAPIVAAIRSARFDAGRLLAAGAEYGTLGTRAYPERLIVTAASGTDAP